MYLSNLLQGDLGPSFKYPEWDVSELIATAFPVSLTLGVLSLLIALCLGIPVGMVAALRRNSWMDYLPMSLSMVGICLPTFVLAPFNFCSLHQPWRFPSTRLVRSRGLDSTLLDPWIILWSLYCPPDPGRDAGNLTT